MELIIDKKYLLDDYNSGHHVSKPKNKKLYLPSVTMETSVQKIVQDITTILCDPLNIRYTFIFKWKDSERTLTRRQKPLQEAAAFQPNSYKFILRAEYCDGNRISSRRASRDFSYSPGSSMLKSTGCKF